MSEPAHANLLVLCVSDSALLIYFSGVLARPLSELVRIFVGLPSKQLPLLYYFGWWVQAL